MTNSLFDTVKSFNFCISRPIIWLSGCPVELCICNFGYRSNYAILWLIRDSPVVSMGENQSTWQKPPPNPKSLAIFLTNPRRDSNSGFGERQRAVSSGALDQTAIRPASVVQLRLVMHFHNSHSCISAASLAVTSWGKHIFPCPRQPHGYWPCHYSTDI